MPQARFFVDAALAEGDETPLPPEVAHHAVRVLRLREGDPVTVFNGRGGEFSAHLSVQGARAWAHLERFDPVERESPLAVTLVQAWVATDKLEWIAEKAVELGVTDITLVPAARSVVHLDGPRMERRLARLREIVIAACCQSGRNRTPAVTAATSLERGLRDAVAQGARGIVLDPRAPEPLLAAANAVAAVALAIGPEGGFDDNEQALAARVGYRPARLGPRILRTETAGLAALVVLQAMAGDLRAVPGAQSDS
jgi:16S rRNA (uracil1498-N3)-methyltransferase